MKKVLALGLAACLLLSSAHALADADRFCDELPQGVREVAKLYNPDEDYIDCVLFPGTPLGDYCLVLSPWNMNGYLYADGAWTLGTQVTLMRQETDMRLYFRRHAAGAAPDLQGACGLIYPDDRGFDLIESIPGFYERIVKMLQFHWSENGFRLIGWQSGAAGQFAVWEDGRWVFFDSETGERLGGARIDKLAEYGLLAGFEELPHTLEEALKMESVTRATAETRFPGWTLKSYGVSNMGHDAHAGYYRMEDGMFTIRRIRLSSDAGGVISQTDSMPVPLSEALLRRLETEDMDSLLDIRDDVSTFCTDDAFDRTKIPVTDTVLQSDLQTHGLLLLTEDADGVRRLRWVEQDGEGYTVRSSRPLPDDTSLDLFHCGDDSVIVRWDNQRSQCSFSRTADGSWTLGWVTGNDGFSDMHGTLYCGIQKSIPLTSPGCILVGSHPWGDLFTIDFTQLPVSTEEAAAELNRDGWAVVNNPDPADRLALRAEPDTASESLGEFRSCTPVQVLAQQGDWSRVRIGLDGRLEGWMMTEYLAFGSAMDAATASYWELRLGDAYEYHPLFASPAMRETTGVLIALDTWIVGVVGDELYILLDSDGNTGYLPQSWFWNGNE